MTKSKFVQTYRSCVQRLQRTLGQRFFTPQYEARKSARRQPRKSLCDDFGPPVKFQALLATPVREAVNRMDYGIEEQGEKSEAESVKQEIPEDASDTDSEQSGEQTVEAPAEPVSYQQEYEQAELRRQQEAVSETISWCLFGAESLILRAAIVGPTPKSE